MAVLYLLYFLRDRVHYSHLFPGQKAENGLLILTVVYTAAVVVTAVTGGVIFDRSGRRKLPVTVAGLVMAVPAVMLALWPTWPVAVASAALMGLGFGAYLSVDQALVTQVLPSARARAKDLGVINIASYGARVLAPAIAAPLVSQLGGYQRFTCRQPSSPWPAQRSYGRSAQCGDLQRASRIAAGMALAAGAPGPAQRHAPNSTCQ